MALLKNCRDLAADSNFTQRVRMDLDPELTSVITSLNNLPQQTLFSKTPLGGPTIKWQCKHLKLKQGLKTEDTLIGS